MYKVEVSKGCKKYILSLSKKNQNRIVSALEGLSTDPFIGKKLKGSLYGLWVIRVVPFRIIYTINKEIVTVSIVSIGNRKDVYKKLK